MISLVRLGVSIFVFLSPQNNIYYFTVFEIEGEKNKIKGNLKNQS